MPNLPKLDRDTKLNLAFGALCTGGLVTLATGGRALPVIIAGGLAEMAFATIGCEATKTVLRWVDRRGGKYTPATETQA